MSNLVETVRKEILDALEKDQLSLPTLPEVALRVRAVAEDPDAAINDLTAVISQDPAMAARIIRVTNSPLLRAPIEVKDLNVAISRLGMSYTANLAVGLAMEQMFQATLDFVDQRLRQTWSSTTKIASLAHIIAQRCTRIPPDEATLAALVLRIGVLPILAFAEERDDLINDGISLDKIIYQLHPELGQMILQQWDFPETISKLPATYRNYQDDSGQPLTAVIQVANLIHFQKQEGRASDINWATVPAFGTLELNPEPTDTKIIEFQAIADAAGDFF